MGSEARRRLPRPNCDVVRRLLHVSLLGLPLLHRWLRRRRERPLGRVRTRLPALASSAFPTTFAATALAATGTATGTATLVTAKCSAPIDAEPSVLLWPH